MFVISKRKLPFAPMVSASLYDPSMQIREGCLYQSSPARKKTEAKDLVDRIE